MNIFATLVQGDSARWADEPVTLNDGRVADGAGGWALKYALRGPAQLDLTAEVVSGVRGWQTSLTTQDSASLAVGAYSWAALLSKGDERLTAGGGRLVITPDLSALAAPFDGRSTAAKALEACEAAMATFNATGGKIKRYDIAGRTMEFQTIGELMQLHAFWKLKVASESTVSQIAQGLGNPRNLHVRFVKPA
jgi:hypothetical protein